MVDNGDTQILGCLSDSNPRRRTLLYKFSLFLIWCLAVLSIFSPLRAFPYFNQLWTVCILGWIAVTILDSPKYIFRPSAYRLSVYVFLIYTITIAYITNTAAIGNRFFELAQIPLFYMAYQKNKLFGWGKDNLRIIAWVIPFVLITSYLTIKTLLTNPWASRGSGNVKVSDGIELVQKGVGGYFFIYFLVFAFAILLFILFNKKHLFEFKYKIIDFFVLFMFAVNIILSNYTTALMLVILSILIRFFGSRLLGKYKVIYLLGFFIFFVFSTFLLNSILNYLAEFLVGSSNAARLVEIQKFLFSNEIGQSSAARVNVFNESIQAFFHNPIFGIIINTSSVSQIGKLQGLGNHSQILDTFALFGFGIGMLQLFIYLKPIFGRIKNIDGSFSVLSITILLLLCILFTINTATPSIGFAVYFIFPTAYDWIQKNSNYDNVNL